MPLYAGIDIGIKNLSFCIIDSEQWESYESGESADPGIVQWENLNILGSPEICRAIIKSGKQKGSECGKKAAWKSAQVHFCGRHKPENGKPYSAPRMKNIRSQTLKIKLFAELDKYPAFDNVSKIVLELQPRKNQQMRTFCASIESYFIIRQQLDKETPTLLSIKTIHAKNKLLVYSGPRISADHIKSDYDKRKYLARMHTEYFLKNSPETLEKHYHQRAKRDDLADSFLYALWAVKERK